MLHLILLVFLLTIQVEDLLFAHYNDNFFLPPAMVRSITLFESQCSMGQINMSFLFLYILFSLNSDRKLKKNTCPASVQSFCIFRKSKHKNLFLSVET